MDAIVPAKTLSPVRPSSPMAARWPLVLVLIVATTLSLINLGGWPPPWYDEGLFLQVAKNLAQQGRYGVESSEGFRAFDPLINAGPPLTVAMAAVFKVFGTGLLQARLVTVVYSAAALACFYFLAEAVSHRRAAVLATLLLLATPLRTTDLTAGYLPLSRMAMGEIPALAFMVAGLWCWTRAVQEDRRGRLLAAAVLFGLMVVTKPQSVVFLAAFVLAAVVDRLTLRHARPVYWWLPLTVSLAMFLFWRYLPILLGVDDAAMRTGGWEAIKLQAMCGAFYPQCILQNARTLASTVTPLLAGLGMALMMPRWRRSEAPWALLLPFCFCVVWAAWFVVGSIGWLRYGFPMLALANLFVALLLAEGLEVLRRTRWRAAPLAAHAAIGLAVLVALKPWTGIIAAPDDSARAFARYLDATVPASAIIETFEADLPFASDRVFHQPRVDVLNAAIRRVRFGVPYGAQAYDVRLIRHDYLVDGPLSRATGLYGPDLAARYEHVVTIGGYTLYRTRTQPHRSPGPWRQVGPGT